MQSKTVCTLFVLGLQLVCWKQKKFTCQFAFSSKSLHWQSGTEMFTSEVTKQQKKFALLHNKFAFWQNKFAFWQNKFAFWQNKFAFWPKKVYILVNKFTTFIEKLPNGLHNANLVNLVNFSKKFTPFCPPMQCLQVNPSSQKCIQTGLVCGMPQPHVKMFLQERTIILIQH